MTKRASYSEGPWTLDEFRDEDSGEEWFRISARSTLNLTLRECSDGYQVGQNRANAHLIVNAPEIAAVLRMVRNLCRIEGETEAGVSLSYIVDKALAKVEGDYPYRQGDIVSILVDNVPQKGWVVRQDFVDQPATILLTDERRVPADITCCRES